MLTTVGLLTCQCKSSLPEAPAPAAVAWWSAGEAWSSRTTPGQEDSTFTAGTLTTEQVRKQRRLTDPLRIGAPGSCCRRDAGQATPGCLRLRLDDLTFSRDSALLTLSCQQRERQVGVGGADAVTSPSLSELDSVSLAPACDSERGTATMVPSWLTWAFSVILSIPGGCKIAQ